MSTVALFGGSFNPPHIAHQMVALLVIETAPVDQLWFVPAWDHPFAKRLVSFEHRAAMCELLARDLPRAQVSQIELERAASPSYTLHTIEALIARHPEHAFRLVIGADILGETDKWHRWDEVVRLAPPIVVGRGGHPIPDGGFTAGLVMPEVSSTEIRARLARGESALPLVPRSVMSYIADNGLYR